MKIVNVLINSLRWINQWRLPLYDNCKDKCKDKIVLWIKCSLCLSKTISTLDQRSASFELGIIIEENYQILITTIFSMEGQNGSINWGKPSNNEYHNIFNENKKKRNH